MLEILLIIVVTACDALRDRWIFDLGAGRWTRKQWRWHAVKWIAFYLPLIYVLTRSGLGWVATVALAIVCLGLWRWLYGREW